LIVGHAEGDEVPPFRAVSLPLDGAESVAHPLVEGFEPLAARSDPEVGAPTSVGCFTPSTKIPAFR
jgi:hypothetical protein